MNYGKKEVEKTLRKTNSRSQKITSHLVLLLTKIILILVLILGYGIWFVPYFASANQLRLRNLQGGYRRGPGDRCSEHRAKRLCHHGL